MCRLCDAVSPLCAWQTDKHAMESTARRPRDNRSTAFRRRCELEVDLLTAQACLAITSDKASKSEQAAQEREERARRQAERQESTLSIGMHRLRAQTTTAFAPWSSIIP